MTKLLFIPIVLSTVISSAFAHEIYQNELSLLIGDSENGFHTNMARSLAYQLQFQYNGLDFPIRPEISFIHSQNIELYSTGERSKYTSMAINGVYEVPYTERLTPYLKAGAGYSSFSDRPESPDSGLFIDAAAGIKLNLTDRWSLKFETLAGVADSHLNILATGGISFRFGRKYVEPEPRPAVRECAPCKESNKVFVYKKPVFQFSAEDLKFNFAKASLTFESRLLIKDYSKKLNSGKNKERNILLIGNTDNKGSRSLNATLAIKRANSVRRELILNDVLPNRISIEGLGEMNPIADNNTAEGRQKNRRVVIILRP